MNFFILEFLLIQKKEILLHVSTDEKKNTKILNLFHVLNMLKKV